VPMGHVQGKMIAMFGADDFNVWPATGVRYHKAVLRALGKRTDDHFRIHFFEHGVHGGAAPNALDRQVPDGLVTYKALDDLMAWVERGVAPAPGTRYSLDKQNQLVLPKSAAARGGYQPVVELRAGGETARLEIAPGAEVKFHAEAEDPDNEVVREEIDFEGDNQFDETQNVRGKKVVVEFRHRYDKPGTYFPTVRVTDSTLIAGAPSRSGLQNLASVRVVVKAAEASDWERLPDGSVGRVEAVWSGDRTVIAAFLRKPAGEGPFPVVVVLHGGSNSTESTYAMGRSMKSPIQDFVSAGWAVFSIDFRPNATFEPSEWRDTIAAVEAVRRFPFIDARRVALLGASHGGHVMARVAARIDARCAALWSPSALDLGEMKRAAATGAGVDKPRLELLISMMERVKDPAAYLRGSAFTETGQIRCPLLIVNGRNDISSPPMIMEPYVAKLRAAGKQVETYFPDNGPHGFYFGNPEIPESREARRRTVEFFGRFLGER
jgi:dienelactone hydrolase